MRRRLATLLVALTLPLLMGAGQPGLPAQPASQPEAMALPTADSASQAVTAVADKALPANALGAPRLFDQAQGLAVDRVTDAKNPNVVALVGASWLIPPKADGKGLGYVLDRGTGRLVARASEVVPMPAGKSAVSYFDEWQIAAGAIGPNDAVGQSYGSGLMIRLDQGGGSFATMTLMPGMGGAFNLGDKAVRIKFASGTGKMLARTFGATVQIQAVSDDNAYMASLSTQKAGGKIEERFGAILAALADRPATTRIWPADARPRLSAEGWSTVDLGNETVVMWRPTVAAAGAAGPDGGNGGIVINGQNNVIIQGRVIVGGKAVAPQNGQVYVAALVLHPYDLPPGVLIDGLTGAKALSSRPAELGDWVGVEKTVELQAPTTMMPAQFMMLAQPPAGMKVPMTTYQVRVLDLHRDVRRLIIRCQAPKDQFDKLAADFDKLVKQMKLPPEPIEPVVVPLDPATYKAPKK